MTRKEFIKMCGILGITAPFTSTLKYSKKDDESTTNLRPDKKVIIVGAGVGGLSAGYFLNQKHIDFEILEASSKHGGRIKINTDFADFPIPLGAEWIETNLGIFDEIVNDSSVKVNIQTFRDSPDYKFLNGSWFTFFEKYIIPSISNKITYNSIVQSIDYSGNKVIINTQSEQRIADKVIITVPVQILRDGDITFKPKLPQSKIDAIANVEIWEGFKAFFEFSTNFYGDGKKFTMNLPSDGEKLYYDATYGQKSTKNILGIFVVGKPAKDYIFRNGNNLKNFILDELDQLFSNQATKNYVNHISQNWNNEPFIKSGYISENADWRMIRELGKSVNNKLFFAGGAYTDGENWVSVHAAALSAKSVVGKI